MGLAKIIGLTPSGLTPSPPRRWTFRGVMALAPLLLLAAVELALRLAGFGYPASFFLPTRETGQPMLKDNRRFGWRFFPPSEARTPEPVLLAPEKPPGTVRIIVFGGSAAMGDPAPSYGLPRQLECALQARHPGQRVEVINTAMTAINSHVVREIARDCRRLQADFWVVYAGNNEVVGPFGAGTVFGRQAAGLRAVRLTLALKWTRIGQLIAGLGQPRGRPEWEGMEMFLKNQVRRGDPRMKNVYANFAANLASVIELGRSAGAKVLLLTVPVNLRDCPPFGSLHRAGISGADLRTWQQDFAAGLRAETNGDFARAMLFYGEAAKIDDQYAELVFRQGVCRLRLHQDAWADADFRLARDLDTLRFRADSRVNQIVRQTAAAQDVPLVDAETACARRSSNGIPGDQFFYDHVHLNFRGNYLVASLVASQLEKTWPGAHAPSPAGAISEAEVARRLAFTGFDRRRILEEMRARFGQPPFRSQDNFEPRDQQLAQRLATLSASPTNCIPVYRQALKLAPGDWRLHANFGRLLEAAGRPSEAFAQWKDVTRLMPHWPEAWFRLGFIAHDAKAYAEAEADLREALKHQPDLVEAWNELGLVMDAQGNAKAGSRCFEQALRLKPGFSPARVNLAVLLSDNGDSKGAQAEYREVLRGDTHNVNALNNLGNLLAKEGRPDQALPLYREVLRLSPTDTAAHFNMARALVALERHQEAVAHYEVVVRKDPTMAVAQLELGLELARVGKLDEALTHLGEAAQLKPDWPAARFNYGIALEKEGRYAQAAEEFRATLRLDPNHPAAAEALRRISDSAAR